MKHFKLFFALFAMLALNVGNAWGAVANPYVHTFASGDVKTTAETAKELDGVTWSISSATYVGFDSTKGVQIGSSKKPQKPTAWTMSTPISSFGENIQVTKVEIAIATASSGGVTYTITAGDQNATATLGATTSVTTKSLDCSANPVSTGTLTISLLSTKSKAVYIKSVKVTYETASGTGETAIKTLQSIEVTPKTVDYETGDVFKFDGTCTATYSVTKNGEPQADETAVVTPTTVSTPDMSTAGTKEITVTYTEGDVTVTDKYEINVTENVVTPGESTGNLNNVFFGCATGNNATEQSGKFDDVLVVAGCKSTAQTKTNYQSDHVRFYADSYLTLSVPAGYVIKSIVFTAGGDWKGSITASTGTYDNNTKTWTGNAQEVKFSFAQQNRIKSVKVTYAADVKYALNITTPSNGTLVVKEGSTVLTDGAQVYEGTKLVVTPTPNAGYVFESLTVDGTPVDLTEGSYNLTMPAANVTIAATFKANEKPAATLTLSKNGETEDITGYKQDDKVTLPSITSDCVKEFVGWSADANRAIEPEYKAGDEYTLVETAQTLYAVYATVGGGGEATAANTLSSNGWANESKHTSLEIDENVKATITGGGNSGKYYTSGTNWRLYQNENATITISTTIGELKSVKFTFTYDKTGTLLYNGTQLTSGIAVEISGTSATFTVGNSGTATNGQIRISKIEVVYTGGVSYSNYSTTCVAALDEPVFSVEGGENEAKTITLTATKGTIYYTLDGTTPDSESTEYTTPIVLDECGEHTIKAIAISSDSESPVASATYTIQLPIEKGSEENPLSVADVLAIYNGGCYNGTDEVYVTGTVSSASYNTTYSNYTVTLTDNSFQFYRLVDENNLVTTNAMQAGDVLIAKGKLGEYQGKCQLIECVLVDYKAYEGVKTDISNNVNDPYTVEEAYALIDDVSSDLENSNVYVKGIISKVDSYNSTYKSITYWISDDGTTTKQLQVYSGKNLNNTDFGSKNDLQVGDKVTVFGKLKKHETTYEFDYNNYLVSFERPEQEETVAALPFTFTGSLSDVENTDGMKQSGLGSYNTSLKLKFDDTGDYLTIHFDGEPGRLRYGIKGNPSNNVMNCIYKVQTSVDGTTYTDLETYTTLANTEKTMSHALNSDVRYVKFIFTEKKSGNVALGNITISQPAIVIGDGDNSSVLAAAIAAGNPVDVIVNRSFTANDGYYTLCLPFNMPASVIGTAYKLGTITKHVSGEGININLASVSTIEAGVPYLIEPNQTVSELLVENVTIDNTTGSNYTITGAGVNVTFTGIINGVGEQTNGTTEYYVGDNGYLYNGTVDKLGLRAFFTITDETGNPTKVRARVVAGENVETGIEDIFSTDAPVKVIENGQLIIIRDGVKYNVQGQKL